MYNVQIWRESEKDKDTVRNWLWDREEEKVRDRERERDRETERVTEYVNSVLYCLCIVINAK